MLGGYSISVEAVDDYILNTHVSTKLRHAPKNRIDVKTCDNHNRILKWTEKKYVISKSNNY